MYYNNNDCYYYTSLVPVSLPPTIRAQPAPVRHPASSPHPTWRHCSSEQFCHLLKDSSSPGAELG